MIFRIALSAFLLIAALAPVQAQDWPSRNVTVIVPIPAGVTSDIVARVVFEQVGSQVGHTFVVENRPGAGGTIGGNLVAKATPDGHTLLVWGAIAAANALYEKLPYDTLKDFTPLPRWARRRLSSSREAKNTSRSLNLLLQLKTIQEN